MTQESLTESAHRMVAFTRMMQEAKLIHHGITTLSMSFREDFPEVMAVITVKATATAIALIQVQAEKTLVFFMRPGRPDRMKSYTNPETLDEMEAAMNRIEEDLAAYDNDSVSESSR